MINHVWIGFDSLNFGEIKVRKTGGVNKQCKKTYTVLMAWIFIPYIGINALLLNSYLDTDGHVGGFSLVVFNLSAVFLGVVIYLIIRFTSDR